MSETLFKELDKPYIFSFSSPKGGVGVTLLATNFAIQLAKKGKSVLLVDLALTKAFCHLALGMHLPEKNLSSLLAKKGGDLKDCIVQTPVGNLFLIAGLPENLEISNPPYLIKQKIITELKSLMYDYVILDCGSGTSTDLLDFILSANCSFFVLKPNVLSYEPFYRYIRAILHRFLITTLNKRKYQQLKEKINFLFPLSDLVKIDAVEQKDIQEIENSLNQRHFGFVFTGSTEKDNKLGQQLESLIRDFFKIKVEFLGTIEWDREAEESFINMEPISKNRPVCQYSLAVEKFVNRILKGLSQFEEPYFRFEIKERERTAYEILEIPFNAQPKEIQNAYQKKVEIFSENSNITFGLLTKEEKEKERDLLEHAYKVLINSSLRQKYDEELIQKKIIKEEDRIKDYREYETLTKVSENKELEREEEKRETEEIVIPEVSFYDGPSIKKIRMAMKVSIEEIVLETNIRRWYIESIEEERYESLPERMYLRGFLKQIAQYLKLPVEKVLRDYLEKYDAWLEKKKGYFQ